MRTVALVAIIGASKMDALDRLQRLIDQLNAKSDGVEYSLDYHAKNEATNVGYAERGYYLITRTNDTPAPKPGDSNWQEYVDGEFIGDNYKQVKAHLENLLT